MTTWAPRPKRELLKLSPSSELYFTITDAPELKSRRFSGVVNGLGDTCPPLLCKGGQSVLLYPLNKVFDQEDPFSTNLMRRRLHKLALACLKTKKSWPKLEAPR